MTASIEKFFKIHHKKPDIMAKGRNGLVQSAGIEVYTDTTDNIIRITPITSKGALCESAYQELPLDKTVLTQLIDHLQTLRDIAP